MSLIDDIRNGESDRLEFKEIPNDNSGKWMKTAVAGSDRRGIQVRPFKDQSRSLIPKCAPKGYIRDSAGCNP